MDEYKYTISVKSVIILVSVVAAAITAVVSAWKYFNTKKREQDRLEFDNFNNFLKKVVDLEKGNTELYSVVVQAAHIYELRYFKRYHSFSLRLLKRLKKKWEEEPTHPAILEEVNDSIKYFEENQGTSSEIARRFDNPSPPS